MQSTRCYPHAFRPVAARGGWARLAGLVLCGLLAVTAAWKAPLHLAVVSGQSMSPTLAPGQPLVYAKLRPNDPPLRRGDVVLVRLGGTVCVKRILALGDDRFWTRRIGPGDYVLLDPHQSIRRWRARYPELAYFQYHVPADHLFVVGDNLLSIDSRQLGPVPASEVLGRVVYPGTARDVVNETAVYCSMPAPPRRRRRS